jgi:hypothetical protein
MELITISKPLGKTSLLQIYNQNEDTRQITETFKIIKKTTGLQPEMKKQHNFKNTSKQPWKYYLYWGFGKKHSADQNAKRIRTSLRACILWSVALTTTLASVLADLLGFPHGSICDLCCLALTFVLVMGSGLAFGFGCGLLWFTIII